MTSKTAITVHRSREEVQRLWSAPGYEHEHVPDDAAVTFKEAPADRGTEIHVELRSAGLGGLIGGAAALAKARDDLRRFKALAETGEIARSDAVPEGELAERKFKRRPAQPLPLEEVTAR